MRPLTPLRFAKITRINLIEIWSSLLLSIINNFNRNLIITSSFVTSINNFNLARVAIESWKKKKETTRYNFLPFFLSSTNVLFFFFSPPFFRVFSTRSLFSYFLQIERNSTIPTDIRVCDRFFPRAFLLFFHCRVPLWIAAPPIYIYIYTQQRLSVRCARKIPGKNTRRLIEFDEKKFGEERLFIHRGMEDGITKGSLFFPLLFFTRWKRVFISHSR